jgi:hypothetical protein
MGTFVVWAARLNQAPMVAHGPSHDHMPVGQFWAGTGQLRADPHLSFGRGRVLNMGEGFTPAAPSAWQSPPPYRDARRATRQRPRLLARPTCPRHRPDESRLLVAPVAKRA